MDDFQEDFYQYDLYKNNMSYIKLLDVPLKCPKCGITRVAMGMKMNTSLRSSLDGERPSVECAGVCPDCGEIMEIDERLKNL
jgi:hypothetical protein